MMHIFKVDNYDLQVISTVMLFVYTPYNPSIKRIANG